MDARTLQCGEGARRLVRPTNLPKKGEKGVSKPLVSQKLEVTSGKLSHQRAVQTLVFERAHTDIYGRF